MRGRGYEGERDGARTVHDHDDDDTEDYDAGAGGFEVDVLSGNHG